MPSDSKPFITEDEVKLQAFQILGLSFNDKNAKAGVGQITKFTDLLGIPKEQGGLKAPDAWYLPQNKNEVAIIAELKSSNGEFDKAKEQLEAYIKIVGKGGYDKVVGLFYNGKSSIIYKNSEQFQESDKLYNKNYYLNLFRQSEIDKNKIYALTKRINDNLHFKFGINNLKFRMVFTACALVAQKNGADLSSLKDKEFTLLRQQIINTLKKSYTAERQRNLKLDIIEKQYNSINYNFTDNKKAVNDFIDCVCKLSKEVRNEDYLGGEDVMAIFFNEFTRYKGKSEAGQVFTPDHITSLMCRILDLDYEDRVLDATCGSGSFLIKAMSIMLNQVGGTANEDEREKIYNERIYGIEFHEELFALACANMLIHKDGKTNLTHLDASKEAACEWIKGKKINKVLMNPPYENKSGVLEIVENVLNNVEKGALCAFLLPDNKLEVSKKRAQAWLKKHTLLKIIKLPDEVFTGMASVTTSIFVFEAQKPQNDKKIFACHIKEDGLETIKNQGRHDIKGIWKKKLEDFWISVIRQQSGDESCQWLDSREHLSYQKPQPPFEITEQDFKKVVLDYMLFERGINKKDFEKTLLQTLLYESDIDINSGKITVSLNKDER